LDGYAVFRMPHGQYPEVAKCSRCSSAFSGSTVRRWSLL